VTCGNTFPDAGGSPAAGDFLLTRQKKVTKEKATPVRRLPPAFLSQTGRCATRASRSDSARSTSPGLTSALGGSQGEKKFKSSRKRIDSDPFCTMKLDHVE
jgi:hypothetical protein